MSRYHTGDQIDLKSTSLKFETRNSNGEKTSHDHSGEPYFNCKVFGLVDGKKGNSFNVFFHVILISKLIIRTWLTKYRDCQVVFKQ